MNIELAVPDKPSPDYTKAVLEMQSLRDDWEHTPPVQAKRIIDEALYVLEQVTGEFE